MDRKDRKDPFVTGRFLVLQSRSGPILFNDQSTLRNLLCSVVIRYEG